MSSLKTLQLAPEARVVVLSGAGLSAPSGLPTYRGAGGLWNDPKNVALNTREAYEREPAAVFRMFGKMAALAREVAPNAGHRALAAFASGRPGAVTILTQNVDGLHQRAGSANVVEIHGTLGRLRCDDHKCEHRQATPAPVPEEAPPCPVCGKALRFDIVLFGEYLPLDAERAAKQALRSCDYFLAVGTSGTVSPAAQYVREANYAGARCALLNAEVQGSVPSYFHDLIVGDASKLLPALFGVEV